MSEREKEIEKALRDLTGAARIALECYATLSDWDRREAVVADADPAYESRVLWDMAEQLAGKPKGKAESAAVLAVAFVWGRRVERALKELIVQPPHDPPGAV